VAGDGGRNALTPTSIIEDLLRELAPRVLGAVARRYGDFDAAEDAVQEALVAATTRWPKDGVPEQPLAWLVRAASRRMIDQWRSDESRRAREAAVAPPEAAPPDRPDGDDTLLLLFLCCHPSLTPGSAIPLTLRAVGGLTTAQIARAFLVPETTMAQRISRAKQRIRDSGIGFEMPTDNELTDRLRSVLRVLYLIFNEGYASSEGSDLQRVELADEAILLARMLERALPDEPEVLGLLSLMLLTDARRAARADANGDLIPLPEQDRSRWDRARVAEGVELLDRAMGSGRVGEYRLQAAIAAVHDRAPTADQTDWSQIEALYGLLEQVTGSPVVTLNRAVAVAMADSPAAGLALLDTVEEPLRGFYRLDAVRAHLLEMAGDKQGAITHFRAAAARTTSLPEQRYLLRQAARLHEG
jgi:RNA polymerase sigma factor (sigma-70 family)